VADDGVWLQICKENMRIPGDLVENVLPRRCRRATWASISVPRRAAPRPFSGTGLMGVCEGDNFAASTNTIAAAMAAKAGCTVVGGGDSVAAIEKVGVTRARTPVTRRSAQVTSTTRSDRRDPRIWRRLSSAAQKKRGASPQGVPATSRARCGPEISGVAMILSIIMTSL